MKRIDYCIVTISRNGQYETIVARDFSPVMFLLVDYELGSKTHIINLIEINKEEYEYYQSVKKTIK